jgi:hypothetical protein
MDKDNQGLNDAIVLRGNEIMDLKQDLDNMNAQLQDLQFDKENLSTRLLSQISQLTSDVESQ